MLSTCKQLLRSSTNRLSSTRPLPPHHRSFSVTKLNPHDDTFLLLQHQRKNIYVVGNCHVPKKTADTIFQTINEVKPDTVLVQICQHRADVIHKLSVEHGENLNEHICGEAALKDFTNQYPTSAGIFCKSKTVIKPFELFGLLFSYADYKAIHAALLNQAQIIFADNKMKQCIARFEKSINKMYDPGYVLNPDNMFEKDVNYADLQREMAMGGSPKEIHKRMMKTMLERMMKNKKANHDEEKVQKQKKLLINQQLEIDLEKQQQSGGGAGGGTGEIDWSTVYTRENARVLVNEVRESMQVCVEAFIDERNKHICDTLMNCDGRNIVAFINFANLDGVEDKWLTLS